MDSPTGAARPGNVLPKFYDHILVDHNFPVFRNLSTNPKLRERTLRLLVLLSFLSRAEVHNLCFLTGGVSALEARPGFVDIQSNCTGPC